MNIDIINNNSLDIFLLLHSLNSVNVFCKNSPKCLERNPAGFFMLLFSFRIFTIFADSMIYISEWLTITAIPRIFTSILYFQPSLPVNHDMICIFPQLQDITIFACVVDVGLIFHIFRISPSLHVLFRTFYWLLRILTLPIGKGEAVHRSSISRQATTRCI